MIRMGLVGAPRWAATLVWVLLAIWTLLALLGYWAVGAGGELLGQGAGAIPASAETVGFLTMASEVLGAVGQGVVVVVWALGAFALGAIGIGMRLFARAAGASGLSVGPSGAAQAPPPPPPGGSVYDVVPERVRHE